MISYCQGFHVEGESFYFLVSHNIPEFKHGQPKFKGEWISSFKDLEGVKESFKAVLARPEIADRVGDHTVFEYKGGTRLRFFIKT